MADVIAFPSHPGRLPRRLETDGWWLVRAPARRPAMIVPLSRRQVRGRETVSLERHVRISNDD
jgi:hypothetical protein